jgi:hypothetical protein
MPTFWSPLRSGLRSFRDGCTLAAMTDTTATPTAQWGDPLQRTRELLLELQALLIDGDPIALERSLAERATEALAEIQVLAEADDAPSEMTVSDHIATAERMIAELDPHSIQFGRSGAGRELALAITALEEARDRYERGRLKQTGQFTQHVDVDRYLAALHLPSPLTSVPFEPVRGDDTERVDADAVTSHDDRPLEPGEHGYIEQSGFPTPLGRVNSASVRSVPAVDAYKRASESARTHPRPGV